MKSIQICFFVAWMLGLLSIQANAQVKIGTNPTVVNPNAILEMETSNKGLLLPRISLVAPSTTSPLNAFVKGMLVFNTAANDSVSPGLYYCDGSKWIQVPKSVSVGTSGNDSAWLLSGNSNTNPAVHFMGTTNNQPLLFKTNNTERFRVTENGWLGIGTANPLAALHIKGQLVIDTIPTGNITTDQVLVTNPADGRIKAVPASSITGSVQKKIDTVATTGQTVFTTPAAITDGNKIMLYRNGVMISFTVSGSNTITAEVGCDAGDEIRIVQFL